MEDYHIDKDGKRWLISELKTSHLVNIIRRIELAAERGIIFERGGGSDPDSFWYEKETLYGQEALDYLDYNAYHCELELRKE